MSATKSVKTIKYILTAVNVILLALTVLGVIKTCFVGFDIDEGYAVAQSYRMVMGDNMFSEMWEPHQMSAFGLAIFIAPYLLITGGKTVGLVLYLRVIGTVIHLLLGGWFYKTACVKIGKMGSFWIALCHVNFLPKWLVLAEFEIMQYWAVCVLFLALLTWYDKTVLLSKETAGTIKGNRNKKGFWNRRREDVWLIVAGATLFVAMMTYPTMILLYPVYVIFFLTLKVVSAKEKWRSVLIFTGTTLIIGIVFLVYLRTYMTVEEFLRYVSYIFMDASHSGSLGFKVANSFRESIHFIKVAFMYSPIAIIATGLIGVTDYFINKKKEKKAKATPFLKYLFIFMLIWLGVFIGKQIILCLFGDGNQFVVYFRFAFVAFIGILAYIVCRKEVSCYFWLGILPGIVGAQATMLVTNMSFEVAQARMYIGVIATVFILFIFIKEKFSEDIIIQATGYVVLVSFIIGLIICKLILVRVTGCMPVTVRMDMEWVKEGPAAGLLIDDDLARQYNANIPLIEEYVDEDDKLLYFGCENIYYMVSEADLATPSVQGTTVYNEMFLEYYKEYPERIPNVVIIDKTFDTNPYYNYNPQNQIMLDWIYEEFQGASVTETEYFTILQK